LRARKTFQTSGWLLGPAWSRGLAPRPTTPAEQRADRRQRLLAGEQRQAARRPFGLVGKIPFAQVEGRVLSLRAAFDQMIEQQDPDRERPIAGVERGQHVIEAAAPLVAEMRRDDLAAADDGGEIADAAELLRSGHQRIEIVNARGGEEIPPVGAQILLALERHQALDHRARLRRCGLRHERGVAEPAQPLLLPRELLAHAADRGVAGRAGAPGGKVDGIAARFVGTAGEVGERIADAADIADDLLEVDEVDGGKPRENLGPDREKLLARERFAGRHDGGIEIGHAAVHEAQDAAVELGLDHERQIEHRDARGVPDHDQEAARPPRRSDRGHPGLEELARLIDVHQERGRSLDRGPAGGVEVVEHLDREAAPRRRSQCLGLSQGVPPHDHRSKPRGPWAVPPARSRGAHGR
jgi:hypothetical protein